MNNVVFNKDCMIGMAEYPDKYFDLAVVDPPYGIGFDGEVSSMTISPNMNNERKKRWNNRQVNKYEKKDWDKQPPTQDYWDEIFRVSKDQIIWGGNHFTLPQSRGWIFWDKLMDEGFSLADGELAWTSFDKGVKKFTHLWAGFKKARPIVRIHPTQKPVELYAWIFRNYAKAGMKILDTHVGSGSSRIAAYKYGLDFTGYEIDADYWKAQEERFKIECSKPELFTPTLPHV